MAAVIDLQAKLTAGGRPIIRKTQGMRFASAARPGHLRRVVLAGFVAVLVASCAPVFSAREEPREERVTLASDPPLQLAVDDRGKGEPILLLHGLGTSGYTWRHLVPELAKTHRVITLDLKGFGASDKPDDGKYSVLDQAALVKAFIEQKNLRNLTVIGHSFGGGVTLALALDMAEARPKRLKRIVLVDTIAYKQPLPIFFQLLITPGIGDLGMTLIPAEVQIAEALNIAYYDKEKIPQDLIERYAEPLRSLEAKAALRKTVEQLIPDDIETFTERYQSLTLPVLIVWCEQDKIVPLADGRRLARDIKTATLHVLKHCGHMPQEETPEETLKAIRPFLKS